jgi:16S rRNA (uracil1498-N3)-methyltransferase
VLRKDVGDEIELFDGQDGSYHGRIDRVSDDSIDGVLLERGAGLPLPFSLTLCQGLLKGPKWDWLLEKACEVGVECVVPLLTARTIVQVDPGGMADKVLRWNRIAMAASKQCGRSRVMTVAEPTPFDRWLEGLAPDGFFLIPWEKEGTRSMAEACKGRSVSAAQIFIGPEGGWEDAEVERARRQGAVPVRLGPTLLRSETAGIAASILLLREFLVY